MKLRLKPLGNVGEISFSSVSSPQPLQVAPGAEDQVLSRRNWFLPSQSGILGNRCGISKSKMVRKGSGCCVARVGSGRSAMVSGGASSGRRLVATGDLKQMGIQSGHQQDQSQICPSLKTWTGLHPIFPASLLGS